MSIEAMEQALEALIQIRTPLRVNTSLDAYYVSRAITSLHQAIARAESTLEAEKQTSVSEVEPVGWMHTSGNAAYTGKNCNVLGYTVPLYTHPQPKAEKHEPVACQHKRYSIDVHEQIGTCIDCGSEGRMRFVVDDTHPQPNVTTSDMKQEHVDKTAKQRHEENT